MNIAIDVSPLQSGHKARGIGVYTKELIEALERYGKNHTYQLIHTGQHVPSDADIVHYPYFDPFLTTLPIAKPKPTIVTVHDLIPIVFPDKFPKGIRGALTWQIQKASLKGSRRIITDSQNSKNDIHKIVDFDENKIDVVPLAPSPVFRPVKEKSVLLSLRRKYHVPENFFLYVGDVNWNKNIPGLLEAYAAAVHDTPSFRASLVLVGSAFLNSSIQEVVEINRLIETLNIRTSIVRTGFVPDIDLAGMYSMATCLVQPSCYEGFGLPVLEAMASGCPVIVADNSSLSEIKGPALAVDAQMAVSISGAIKQILQMPEVKRNAIIEKGFEWARTFTWQKVAHETIEVYEKIKHHNSGI